MVNNILIEVLGTIAEQERENIRKRQAEGIAAARARGVQFGRPRKELPHNFGELVRKWEGKIIIKPELLEKCGISGSTLDRRLREHRATGQKIKRTSKCIIYDDNPA